MTKSQFNIKISKDLLIKIKRQAMMSGKSLTEHITDLVTKSLSDDDIQDIDLSLVSKIKALDERLLSLESIVSNRGSPRNGKRFLQVRLGTRQTQGRA
jgi:hypothetical protein